MALKLYDAALGGPFDFDDFVIENLTADPLLIDLTEGRFWYNTTTKRFKFTQKDGLGALEIFEFLREEDFQDFLTNLGSVADAPGHGTKLIGYKGLSGPNGKFSISSVNLESAVDSIVTQIDDIQNQNDISVFVYTSVGPQTSHNIVHNLGAQFNGITLWTKDGLGDWVLTDGGVEAVDANSLVVDFTGPEELKAVIVKGA